ncbi:hypothetical protein LINPERPRIM_LOCUS37416 [Linum perenne]
MTLRRPAIIADDFSGDRPASGSHLRGTLLPP